MLQELKNEMFTDSIPLEIEKAKYKDPAVLKEDDPILHQNAENDIEQTVSEIIDSPVEKEENISDKNAEEEIAKEQIKETRDTLVNEDRKEEPIQKEDAEEGTFVQTDQEVEETESNKNEENNQQEMIQQSAEERLNENEEGESIQRESTQEEISRQPDQERELVEKKISQEESVEQPYSVADVKAVIKDGIQKSQELGSVEEIQSENDNVKEKCDDTIDIKECLEEMAKNIYLYLPILEILKAVKSEKENDAILDKEEIKEITKQVETKETMTQTATSVGDRFIDEESKFHSWANLKLLLKGVEIFTKTFYPLLKEYCDKNLEQIEEEEKIEEEFDPWEALMPNGESSNFADIEKIGEHEIEKALMEVIQEETQSKDDSDEDIEQDANDDPSDLSENVMSIGISEEMTRYEEAIEVVIVPEEIVLQIFDTIPKVVAEKSNADLGKIGKEAVLIQAGKFGEIEDGENVVGGDQIMECNDGIIKNAEDDENEEIVTITLSEPVDKEEETIEAPGADNNNNKELAAVENATESTKLDFEEETTGEYSEPIDKETLKNPVNLEEVADERIDKMKEETPVLDTTTSTNVVNKPPPECLQFIIKNFYPECKGCLDMCFQNTEK
ncbi:unnamed protein product [Hymenolepis diminuta]|uniref:Bromo domain-containing protein n=1 Tax=Hymenolepis diminuta TaxID=6216 RepID=A0A0R3SS33_HYMDI|nr:unnamed protein product [Hymenolepis diminuta]VUZ50212.1 unnamed protein product [Hymenolepis diminuta]